MPAGRVPMAYGAVGHAVVLVVVPAAVSAVVGVVVAGIANDARNPRGERRLRRSSGDDIYSREWGLVVEVVAARGNPSRASGPPCARAGWAPPRRPGVDAEERRPCPARCRKRGLVTAVGHVAEHPRPLVGRARSPGPLSGLGFRCCTTYGRLQGVIRRPGSGRAPGRQPGSSSRSMRRCGNGGGA